ncbi:MAG TPA: hypothetical protein VGC90_10240 [Candidatus Limnocylindrales bacterium]
MTFQHDRPGALGVARGIGASGVPAATAATTAASPAPAPTR